MITITLQCANINEVRAQLATMLAEFSKAEIQVHTASPTPTLDALTKPGTPQVPENEPAQTEFDLNVDPIKFEKKKRRTKAEMEAAKKARDPETPFETKQHDTRAEEPSDEVEIKPTAVSREHVHQALQQVNVAVGLPKAREILAAFKVQRISEIKEEQYAEFINACNQATMMA